MWALFKFIFILILTSHWPRDFGEMASSFFSMSAQGGGLAIGLWLDHSNVSTIILLATLRTPQFTRLSIRYEHFGRDGPLIDGRGADGPLWELQFRLNYHPCRIYRESTCRHTCSPSKLARLSVLSTKLMIVCGDKIRCYDQSQHHGWYNPPSAVSDVILTLDALKRSC